MKPVTKNLLLWVAAPMSVGILAEIPIVNSENGYVAGFIFLPLFVLVIVASFGLFFGGLIATGLKGRPGLWVVLSSIMLFGGFMGMAMVAKEFEIGAYREEPMVSIPPPIANKVLFKKEATHEEIERFSTHVIGYPTGATSSWSRPGIESVARTAAEDGYEVVTFSFRPSATEEQKADIRERIKAYPPVFEYLENVPTATPGPIAATRNGNVNTKKAVIIDSTNTNP